MYNVKALTSFEVLNVADLKKERDSGVASSL